VWNVENSHGYFLYVTVKLVIIYTFSAPYHCHKKVGAAYGNKVYYKKKFKQITIKKVNPFLQYYIWILLTVRQSQETWKLQNSALEGLICFQILAHAVDILSWTPCESIWYIDQKKKN
jgi:hypothetical protein